MFFGNFFVWVPIFDPTMVQYFIQIPTQFFAALYQHMIYDDLSKKKSPHFREKCLGLSYLKPSLVKVKCFYKTRWGYDKWMCQNPKLPVMGFQTCLQLMRVRECRACIDKRFLLLSGSRSLVDRQTGGYKRRKPPCRGQIMHKAPTTCRKERNACCCFKIKKRKFLAASWKAAKHLINICARAWRCEPLRCKRFWSSSKTYLVKKQSMGAIHKMATTLGDSPSARALRGNFSSQRSLPYLAKPFFLVFLFLLSETSLLPTKICPARHPFSSQRWFLLSRG